MSRPPPEADPTPAVVHLLNGDLFGGVERVVATLCRNRRRVRSEAVCLLDGEMRRVSGVACEVVPMTGRLDVGVAVRVARLIRRRRGLLLVTHTLRSSLVGALAARFANVPHVVTVHSPASRETGARLRDARNGALQRLLLPWADAIVAVSAALRDELVSAGVPASRIEVVLNGVETDLCDGGDACAFRSCLPGGRRAAPLVGTHALLRPRKGLEDLLRAAPTILRAHPSCTFVVVGGPERPDYPSALRQLCLDLGIADSVVFTGHRDDIADVLAALDVFVLPSLFGEGLPLALLEAMAAGRAAVATDTEGIREVVESGRTGLLVPPRAPESLAGAVNALLSDPSRRSELGTAAREAARRRFGVGRMTAEAETAYLRVLAARTSRWSSA